MRLYFSSNLKIKEAQEYEVDIKYSMRDVINYCVWSCDMGNRSVYDKIVVGNLKKMEIKRYFTWISV